MAVTHIPLGDQTQHANNLKRALNQLEAGVEGINNELATMVTMIDGDGSDPAQFTYLTTKYAFPDNATAKSAWDELQSLMGKLNSDASVSFVHAAMIQAFAKFR